MAVVVRRARSEDAVTIAKFALALFAQHRNYDPNRFAELGNLEGAAGYYMSRAEADDAAVFVAESDGEVVGFAYLEYERIDYANLLKNAVWLHDLYVDKGSRRTGAGKMLMQAAVEFGKKLGAAKIVLTVAAKNELAQEFFRSSGFRDTMVEMTLNIT
jgi:ribosomal protein S18 acetylase RimI-like enzyme